jgi:hypothetical protein
MTETPDEQLLSPNSWTWNSQAPPPLSGQVRTDSRDWLAAKQLHVDRRNDGGSDVGSDLAAIKANDQIRLEHQTDATRYVRFLVGAPATLATNAYVFPVSYMTGDGTLPNSGTRILVTLLAAVPGTTVNWTITVARDPHRYWITCVCLHGRQAELMANSGGRLPVPQALVPTVAENLRRRFRCTCDQLQPTLPAAAAREGYTFAEVQGYTEVGAR